MAKHLLRNLDLGDLAVALDHAEERGPWGTNRPDPQNDPSGCAYLRYAGAEQMELLTRRLPHIEVEFKTMAAGSRRKVVRKVFHKAILLHILAFLFRAEEGAERFVGSLDSVHKKYWRVL